MSTIPEQPEAGRSNLHRALENLPRHEPDQAAWDTIESRLAADEALAYTVPTLPEHEPDDALWASIAARLDKAAPAVPPPRLKAPVGKAVVRALWSVSAPRRALALAASIVLLLGAWWWLRPTTFGPRETVAYSQEEAAPLPGPATPAPDSLEQQGLSFIDAHCTSLPAVCQTGEFRSLRSQLTELEAGQARLHQDMRRFGESPELLQQQAQLTTLKAAITRDLVQLLLS